MRVETFPYALNGWHSGPVTVTFLCEDAVRMASCPGPTTVTAEGETVVSGTATDLAGHQTPASVTVRVDTAPPAVALTNPTADLTTTDTSLTVTGTVSDALSGLDLVECNGEPATVDQGVATCTVPLRPGRNSVVLLARDAAGHVTSRGVRVTRTGTSTTLTLTPATRTLLVEESAALSLLDDFGTIVGINRGGGQQEGRYSAFRGGIRPQQGGCPTGGMSTGTAPSAGDAVAGGRARRGRRDRPPADPHTSAPRCRVCRRTRAGNLCSALRDIE